jgi:hypothetical protein
MGTWAEIGAGFELVYCTISSLIDWAFAEYFVGSIRD